jgi:hypothetical protein
MTLNDIPLSEVKSETIVNPNYQPKSKEVIEEEVKVIEMKEEFLPQVQPSKMLVQEEVKEIPAPILPTRTLDDINVWSACKFKLSSKMVKIERDRLARIEGLIPRFSDGFNVQIMSKELKVPLKFLVQN